MITTDMSLAVDFKDNAMHQPLSPIALVIDDVTIRDLLHDLLDHAGFRSEVYGVSNDMGQLIRARPPLIIVLLRLVAPIQGLDTLEALRHQCALQSTPVIALTADKEQLKRHRECLARLQVTSLVIPCAFDNLLSTIQSALDSSTSNAATRRGRG